MMQQPKGNLVTTSKDIAVAALNLTKWAIICATLIWVLVYWTPKAAQWWERYGCEETVITKQGTAWESLVEHDRKQFPAKWRERKMNPPKTRICKNGHKAYEGIDCHECRLAQLARYRAKRAAAQKLIAEALERPKREPSKTTTSNPKTRPREFPAREIEAIKAKARVTAERALALAESRMRQPQPSQNPLYISVPGAGYSVRRFYP